MSDQLTELFAKTDLASLQTLVQLVQSDPSVLEKPELKFFANFVEEQRRTASHEAQRGPTTFTQRSAYDLPLGKKFPDQVPAVIEVSKGSRNKYEWDEEIGFLVLDRVLHSAVFYPYDYGFIPQTLCEDGDPLDVLVMGDSPIAPGSVVHARPIAYMVMEDEKGKDEKVLAVSAKDPFFENIKSLGDLSESTLRQITQFFETYKALEKGKWVKVGGWKTTSETHELIAHTHNQYLLKKAAKGKIEYSHN
eukprot:c3543_g1_i1.p1 GENE.c3543_g1_i1~~c3543_g1_i1.p1  ORF type:complete len:249 (-),score=51.57 c3543_g1_i1:25-771(-)